MKAPNAAPTGAQTTVSKAAVKKAAKKPPVAKPEGARPAPTPTAKPKPAINLVSLDDDQEALFLVVYGDPGTRKTTSMLTMANEGTVVVIDADRGLKKRALARHGVKTENVQIHRDISYEALDALYWELKDRISNGEKIVGLIVDTITLAMPHLVEQSVALGVAKAESMNRTRSEFDIYVDDYGTMTEQFRKLLTRRFPDLGIHIVIIAHAKRETDENGGVRVAPAITPALTTSLVGFADALVRVRVENGVQVGDTQAGERWEAKDQLGVLPRVMVAPTFERILGYVDGTLNDDGPEGDEDGQED